MHYENKFLFLLLIIKNNLIIDGNVVEIKRMKKTE